MSQQKQNSIKHFFQKSAQKKQQLDLQATDQKQNLESLSSARRGFDNQTAQQGLLKQQKSQNIKDTQSQILQNSFNKDSKEEIIGSKIKVYHQFDQIWRFGEITYYNYKTQRHQVTFEDGDIENIILSQEQYHLLESENQDGAKYQQQQQESELTAYQPNQLQTPQNKYRKQLVLQSSSESEEDYQSNPKSEVQQQFHNHVKQSTNQFIQNFVQDIRKDNTIHNKNEQSHYNLKSNDLKYQENANNFKEFSPEQEYNQQINKSNTNNNSDGKRKRSISFDYKPQTSDFTQSLDDNMLQELDELNENKGSTQPKKQKSITLPGQKNFQFGNSCDINQKSLQNYKELGKQHESCAMQVDQSIFNNDQDWRYQDLRPWENINIQFKGNQKSKTVLMKCLDKDEDSLDQRIEQKFSFLLEDKIRQKCSTVSKLFGIRLGANDLIKKVPDNQQQLEILNKMQGFLFYLKGNQIISILLQQHDVFFTLIPDPPWDSEFRRPDHPEYDPSTLHIPDTFFKDKNVSEGQKQWWDFKRKNFDAVMLFKMGKFYEMFEMDAHIGYKVLGLIYMRGDQPHCGFPEVNYASQAQLLARAGYKVVVVEQTETPDQLAARNVQLKTQGLPQAKVVRRDKIAVVSKGTLIDPNMQDSKSNLDACFVTSIVERQLSASEQVKFKEQNYVNLVGVCSIDCASGEIFLGQFLDKPLNPQLRQYLQVYETVELVLPKNNLEVQKRGDWGLDKATRTFLKKNLSNAQENVYHPNRVFWDQNKINSHFSQQKYFPSTELPKVLNRYVLSNQNSDKIKNFEGLIKAFGLTLYFLQDHLLDHKLIPSLRFSTSLLQDTSSVNNINETQYDQFNELGSQQETSELKQSKPDFEQPVATNYKNLFLDATAIENLELFDSEFGQKGTLFANLNSCQTLFGKRLLRQYVARPYYQKEDILDRQKAVQDMMNIDSEIPDIERLLNRICDNEKQLVGTDINNIIYYEDQSKQKVQRFVAVMKGFKDGIEAFKILSQIKNEFQSKQVSRLIQSFPKELNAIIDNLLEKQDWETALETGRVIPKEGTNQDYEQIKQQVDDNLSEFEQYLEQLKKVLGISNTQKSQRSQKTQDSDICYVTQNKLQNVLKVPEAYIKKVPRDFELVGTIKGYRKYYCEQLRDLTTQQENIKNQKDSVEQSTFQKIVIDFVQHKDILLKALKCIQEIDVIMSLAAFSSSLSPPVCIPQLYDPKISKKSANISSKQQDKYQNSTVFQAKDLGHPLDSIFEGGNQKQFIRNDINLGENINSNELPKLCQNGQYKKQNNNCLVLTGPNMGGKSTIIRQMCYAIILTQLGCMVPAKSLIISPVDKMYVRMGGKDNLFQNQSTFYIEMAETSTMLKGITQQSFVALDELGRGTATSDGQAIACSVIERLILQQNPRCVFATHYHQLVDQVQAQNRLVFDKVYHMDCQLASKKKSTQQLDQVIFLYKLKQGICPKSHGGNVARLAGVPGSVVNRANHLSQIIYNIDQEQEEDDEQNQFLLKIGLANEQINEFQKLFKIAIEE